MEDDLIIDVPDYELSASIADLCALSEAINNSVSVEMNKRLLDAADLVLLNMKVMAHPYPGTSQ